ncbi:MAG: diacylglycerol kinase family lipid kinase, partial [Planctomycetaceae bacterium]|nr:diacylglycerol kinase family lipid kinase [Planctomycetaceae bacterium]
FVTIVEPHGRNATVEAVARAIDQGSELLVAAGGDGTVNAVAEALAAYSQSPVMGVLPLGTGNDLARTLQIPLTPSEALQSLASGQPQRMDTLQIGSSDGTHLCTNMLTGGNTGRYLQAMTPEMKGRWGPLCYLRGVIDVIRDLHVYQVAIQSDGGTTEEFDALNLFVANGRFSGGGLSVSPEAEIDDGLADVVIVRDGDSGEIAALTSQYVLADYLQHDLIEFRRVRELSIVAQTAMPLTADGDPVGDTPLSVRVQPQSLNILVPLPQHE